MIGRDREREELITALDAAAAGRGSLYLLSGEAGIGKTTLADELEQHARERGFCAAWGRAWQAGGAPAFWPFSEALAFIARDLGGQITP
ncbi:MAG TPA: ATP-binding protein, partial [Polyangiaceae bacterium]|nr:ATP-binding protein [Polyangiaceae bacterium]